MDHLLLYGLFHHPPSFVAALTEASGRTCTSFSSIAALHRRLSISSIVLPAHSHVRCSFANATFQFFFLENCRKGREGDCHRTYPHSTEPKTYQDPVNSQFAMSSQRSARAGTDDEDWPFHADKQDSSVAAGGQD